MHVSTSRVLYTCYLIFYRDAVLASRGIPYFNMNEFWRRYLVKLNISILSQSPEGSTFVNNDNDIVPYIEHHNYHAIRSNRTGELDWRIS